MVSRIGGAALVLVLALATAPDSRAAGPASTAPAGARATPAAKAPAPAPSNAGSRNDAAPPQPQVSQDAAARARMHECAHQWSTIKKAGNAGATTWKEFSATCLVVSR